MNQDELPQRTYSVDELAGLSATPRRTIRYYIQLGLLDRPIGETRAAHYTWRHLRQLLEIRQLTEEGLSLEKIGERLRAGAGSAAVPVALVPGSITVRSHVHLAPGLKLVIEPDSAGISPEQLRTLVREILTIQTRLKQEEVTRS
jgi:DNA-binding transcriptional MerR regulator